MTYSIIINGNTDDTDSEKATATEQAVLDAAKALGEMLYDQGATMAQFNGSHLGSHNLLSEATSKTEAAADTAIAEADANGDTRPETPKRTRKGTT